MTLDLPVEFSDATTGLPPLNVVEQNRALLGVVFIATDGITITPTSEGGTEQTPVRYLSVRGRMHDQQGDRWEQVHLTISVEDIPTVIGVLNGTIG